jgi:hypothetical protein
MLQETGEALLKEDLGLLLLEGDEMAAPHITITQSSGDSAQLKSYRDALKTVITEGPQILAKMATMIDTAPDPDDYAMLEAQYGLQGGRGASAKGELTAVVEALQANPADAASQAGNAALLATKLQQFVNLVG